ncbi:MAG: prolipoprotein diacylglyceryl transferase [Raineya sp.]|nr:prolipoprotein diacylglyceryl transferase [Raineya sp.]MDW8296407.1 prolipoprotein diacylglyceryl transferase [Raineya sp.]
MAWIQKLQERWKVKSAWQVLVILIVFACTGFTILFLKKPIYYTLSIDETTPTWQRIILWVVLILPLYNIFLLLYGFIFGQFSFFWLFVNRLFGRLFWFWRRKPD